MKFIVIVILAGAFWFIGTHPETAEFASQHSAPEVSTPKPTVDPPKVVETLTQPLTTSIAAAAPPAPAPVTPPTPVTPTDNEGIIWNRLIAEGYTREQTAGIMGNLRQEHNFKTDDVAGGLGIAQWIGGRRSNLIARGDYTNIHVQLDFLMHELNGGYASANAAIRSSGLEGATIAFQDQFERCGICMQSQRIQYAYEILGRH